MANNEIKNISQKERVLLEKPGIRIAKLRKNKKNRTSERRQKSAACASAVFIHLHLTLQVLIHNRRSFFNEVSCPVVVMRASDHYGYQIFFAVSSVYNSCITEHCPDITGFMQ